MCVQMKISIIIPVFYNEDNLEPLYKDIKEKIINTIDYEYDMFTAICEGEFHTYPYLSDVTVMYDMESDKE